MADALSRQEWRTTEEQALPGEESSPRGGDCETASSGMDGCLVPGSVRDGTSQDDGIEGQAG